MSLKTGASTKSFASSIVNSVFGYAPSRPVLKRATPPSPLRLILPRLRDFIQLFADSPGPLSLATLAALSISDTFRLSDWITSSCLFNCRRKASFCSLSSRNWRATSESCPLAVAAKNAKPPAMPQKKMGARQYFVTRAPFSHCYAKGTGALWQQGTERGNTQVPQDPITQLMTKDQIPIT